jgi:hypothetical protein
MAAFREYRDRYPRARTYQDRMILIDILIHRYHGELEGEGGGPGTPNLIACRMSEAAEFLNRLARGERSTPGIEANRDRWRELGKDRVYGPRGIG